MVSVSADLLDRIVKQVDTLAEMCRRDAERAKRCRQCGGESDYLVTYNGPVSQGDKARVCEECMERTMVRKHGLDIYVWKQNASGLECVRCGDDVTARGWCVCPRNARLARGDAEPVVDAAGSGGPSK